MKNRWVRIISIILFACLALNLMFSYCPTASAAKVLTEQEFLSAIEQLKKEYPQGKYWNEYNGTDAMGIAKAGSIVCKGTSNADGKTCVSHGYCAYGGSCTCKCGKYQGWQCFGFANLLAYKIFGSYSTKNYSSTGVNKTAGWEYFKSVDKYYAGDNVRINGNHTIFVIKVINNTVYYVDCNASGPCQINWNNSISVTKLKAATNYVVRMKGNTLTGTGASTGTLTIQYNANGGEVSSATYKVTTDGAGLWLRSSTSTSATKLVLIPDATTLTVTQTKTANGYTWGKTTYDGNTGWCAISGGLAERTGYYTDANGNFCKYPSSSILQAKWPYGTGSTNGLYNAATFGLTREGYSFVGWSTNKDGSSVVFDQHDVSIKAEDICPEVATQDKTVTLYAIWKSDQKDLFDLAGANMALGNSLSMNLYVNASDVAGGDYYMEIVKTYADGRANAVKTVPMGDWDTYDTMYYVSFDGVAAKEMTDDFYVTVYHADGTQASNTKVISIEAYAISMLNRTDASSAASHNLMADMLNYGAAAQQSFKYAQDDLANANMTSAHKACATQNFSMDQFTNETVSGTGFMGGNLTLVSNICMNVYFDQSIVDTAMTARVSYTDHNNKKVSYEIPGSEFFVLTGYGFIGVEITTMAAADAESMVTVEILDGSKVVASGSTSVESLAVHGYAATPLYVDLMKFCTAAYNFFH